MWIIITTLISLHGKTDQIKSLTHCCRLFLKTIRYFRSVHCMCGRIDSKLTNNYKRCQQYACTKYFVHNILSRLWLQKTFTKTIDKCKLKWFIPRSVRGLPPFFLSVKAYVMYLLACYEGNSCSRSKSHTFFTFHIVSQCDCGL